MSEALAAQNGRLRRVLAHIQRLAAENERLRRELRRQPERPHPDEVLVPLVVHDEAAFYSDKTPIWQGMRQRDICTTHLLRPGEYQIDLSRVKEALFDARPPLEGIDPDEFELYAEVLEGEIRLTLQKTGGRR
jgi:hypothetical protein